MKNTKNLFLFLGMLYLGSVSMLSFTSCKKDSTTTDSTAAIADVKFTFTASPDGITSFPTGEAIILTSTCTGNSANALKTLKLSAKVTISGVSQTMDTTITLTGSSFSRKDTIMFDLHDATYEVSATLTGAHGPSVTVGPLTFVTNTIDKDMPQLGNQADAKAKFWSAKMKNSYFLADIASGTAKAGDMDFGYCTRTTGNKLISPSSDDATAIYADQWSAANEKITTWTTRNTTGFIKVNSVLNLTTFNNSALDTDSLINVCKAVGEPSNPAQAVVDGDLILYRTVRGTTAHQVYFWGLIYVSSPTGSVVSGVAQAGNAQLIIRYQREK